MKEHELILDVVRERTDPAVGLPPVISRFDLVGRAGQAGIDTAVVGDYLADLVATDNLVRYERDGRTYVCLAEEEHLRRAVTAEAERDDVSKDAVATLNQALAAVDGDGDGDE